MRQLHVIGFTSDHSGLILAGRRGAKTGGFILRVDHALLEHLGPLRGAPGTGEEVEDGYDDPVPGDDRDPRPAAGPDPGSTRPAVQSGLNPREIQARLRAGRTVEEVAAEAGVSTDWVDRFAAPVLAEQAAAVSRAAETVLHTARRGSSDRPLEASVLRNLADRGVALTGREFSGGWSAFHLIDHDWLVRFRFRSRGRALTAEWTLDTASGTLTARNRLGTELGFVTPGRPAAVLSDVDGPANTPARPKAPARKSTKAPARPKAPARKSTKAPARARATAATRATRATPRARPAAKETTPAPTPARAKATTTKAAPARARTTGNKAARTHAATPRPAARTATTGKAPAATTGKAPAATPRPAASAPASPRRPGGSGATTGGAGGDRVAAVRRSSGAPQPSPRDDTAVRTGRSGPDSPTGPPPVSGLLARTAVPATGSRPPEAASRAAPAGPEPRRAPGSAGSDSAGSDAAYRRPRMPETGPRPAATPAPRATQAPPPAGERETRAKESGPQAPSLPAHRPDGGPRPATGAGPSLQPNPDSGAGEPGRFRRFRAGRPDRPLRAARRPATEDGPQPGRSSSVTPAPPAGDRRPTGVDGRPAPSGRPVIRADSARSGPPDPGRQPGNGNGNGNGPADPAPGPDNRNGNGRVRILDDRAVPPRPGPRG